MRTGSDKTATGTKSTAPGTSSVILHELGVVPGGSWVCRGTASHRIGLPNHHAVPLKRTQNNTECQLQFKGKLKQKQKLGGTRELP